jgi:hypothetical protein
MRGKGHGTRDRNRKKRRNGETVKRGDGETVKRRHGETEKFGGFFSNPNR